MSFDIFTLTSKLYTHTRTHLLTQAFTVAENELDIPALLDAEDMVALSVPDKLSIATYLVQYYNYFKDRAPSSQAPGPKVTMPPSKPLGETPPAAKRTKVETIGPASVHVKATPPSPKMAAMDKKSVSSPLLGQKTTPTHITKPHPSPAEEKGSSKESTPEPSEEGRRVRKGRRSKFKSPSPNDDPTVTPAAPARNAAKRGSMGSENCDACGQRVFLMERLAVEGHIFHRPCFKCFTCKCLLKPGSYEFDSKGGVFYCQAHYREAIRQSTLKRTMQQRGLLNGDEAVKELTEAKRKKEETRELPTSPAKAVHSPETQQPTSPAKAVQSPVTSPTREITREESQKIKAGLPSLLKSLAGNKHEGKESEGTPTSPKHGADKVKVEAKAEPTKTGNRIVVQSTSAPAKPQPPKLGNQSPRGEPSAGKVGGDPPRRPTWSPKIQPRELTKKTPESAKVATNESPKMAATGPPRRPTWSPNVQPRELHNVHVARTTPAESAKVAAATGGGAASEPPRRPTWSPKIQPREIPKGQPESPKVGARVGGEAPRRPAWSPKIQPGEGTKSKGELPKTTLAWLAKGKEVETIRGQSSPKPLRHATVSGIPAKPSPPITAAVPVKPHPPVTVGQKQDQKKVVSTGSIPEEPVTTRKEAPPTSTAEAAAGPIKPPRRKKPHPPTQEVTHPPAVETADGKRAEVPAQQIAETGGKREGMIPKRPAPLRPNRPPSIKRPPLNRKKRYVTVIILC